MAPTCKIPTSLEGQAEAERPTEEEGLVGGNELMAGDWGLLR